MKKALVILMAVMIGASSLSTTAFATEATQIVEPTDNASMEDTVVPKGTKINYLVKGYKKITVRWEAISKGIDGYQIRYSTSSDMSSAKKKTYSGATTNFRTITGLAAGTTYYVQIRTYKEVGAAKYYSEWSGTKKITTSSSKKAAIVSASKPLVVVIDPGHGGDEEGCTGFYDGKTIREKDINLKIAKAIKAELLTYSNVKVYMTRSSDKTVSMTRRGEIGIKYKPDLFISVHSNARGDAQSYPTGSSVLVSSGQYHKALATEEESIANKILTNENKLCGIQNRGLLKRKSSTNKYPNGKYRDYYAIVNKGITNGYPAIIVEHGFLDSESDYRNFLSTNAKLKALGIADATAIAQEFGLKKTDGSVSFDPAGKRVSVQGNWLTINGNTYYYKGTKESFVTGLYTVKSGSRAGKYYFNSKGKMLKSSWKKISGKWYYFNSVGKAYKNTTKTIAGKKYKFNKNGVCTNKK